MKKFNIQLGTLSAMILIAALSRLLPHPNNFTAVGAMALFGVAYIADKKWAFLIPSLALWISDILLNNIIYREYYPEFTLIPGTLLTTYLPFALIVLMGLFTLRKVNVINVLGTSLAASVIFFLVSNFFVWYHSVNFPQTTLGFMACYYQAVPYFWNTLAGDLFFVGVLFGGYELAKRRFPILSVQ